MLKRSGFRALRLVAVLAAVEGAARLALRLTASRLGEPIRTTQEIFQEQADRLRALLLPDTTRLLALDPVLGWRYRAGHRDPANQTNGQGLRSGRAYSPVPAAGVVRVAVFGNSFVYCNEVANEDAWPAQIERRYSGIEVLNYGVGGYGVDQAYLRFLLEGARLAPHVVVIGFAPDDLGRVVNVYRRFRSNREIPLVKPRYLLDAQGRLALLPVPLRTPADYARYLAAPRRVIELGVHDQWYEPAIYEDPLYDRSAAVRLATEVWIRARRRYLGRDRLVRDGTFNPTATAFRIQVALFRQFAEAVRAHGARPLVVLFPDAETVRAARQGRRTVFASLGDALRTQGLPYLDVTEAFRKPPGREDPGVWFMPGGHYSPAGNRRVAEWLGPRLAAPE